MKLSHKAGLGDTFYSPNDTLPYIATHTMKLGFKFGVGFTIGVAVVCVLLFLLATLSIHLLIPLTLELLPDLFQPIS